MFKERGYEIVEGALDKQTCQLLKHQVYLDKRLHAFKHGVRPDSKMYSVFQRPILNSYSVGHAVFTDAVTLLLRPVMESVTGKKLIPTYAYMRIYDKGSELVKHTDREACEVSATITIDADDDPSWPIHLTDLQGNDVSVSLRPGDLMVYSGREVPHWRRVNQGGKLIQLFIHYVDADGDLVNFKYDERPILGIQPIDAENTIYGVPHDIKMS